MYIDEQIELIELQSNIADMIEADIPYITIIDRFDRELILILPTRQKSGTNYQNLTYANVCAGQAVENMLCLEDLEEDTLDCYNKTDKN